MLAVMCEREAVTDPRNVSPINSHCTPIFVKMSMQKWTLTVKNRLTVWQDWYNRKH
jgi:hypothetical protein